MAAPLAVDQAAFAQESSIQAIMKAPTRIEPITQTGQVMQLLSRCELQTADIGLSASLQFFGCHCGSELAGVIGLERYGSVALLRSLGVAPAHRNAGMGRALVAFAEAQAASRGVESLFLLTTTMAPFFAKLGYSPTSRGDAPESIRATSQFSRLCPASSTFMSMRPTTTSSARRTTVHFRNSCTCLRQESPASSRNFKIPERATTRQQTVGARRSHGKRIARQLLATYQTHVFHASRSLDALAHWNLPAP